MTQGLADPVFASAHSALMFAYNFSPAQYAPSVIGRLMGGPAIGGGKGLVGMDGAGQAGMILREVEGLGASASHFLAARFAPRSIPCTCRAPCCAGYRHALAWDHAIAWISEEAIHQLPRHSVNFRLRYGLVCRYFGERVNMTELAKHAGCNRDTASQHNGPLVKWLAQEEGAALRAADAALKAAGIAQ